MTMGQIWNIMIVREDNAVFRIRIKIMASLEIDGIIVRQVRRLQVTLDA